MQPLVSREANLDQRILLLVLWLQREHSTVTSSRSRRQLDHANGAGEGLRIGAPLRLPTLLLASGSEKVAERRRQMGSIRPGGRDGVSHRAWRSDPSPRLAQSARGCARRRRRRAGATPAAARGRPSPDFATIRRMMPPMAVPESRIRRPHRQHAEAGAGCRGHLARADLCVVRPANRGRHRRRYIRDVPPARGRTATPDQAHHRGDDWCPDEGWGQRQRTRGRALRARAVSE